MKQIAEQEIGNETIIFPINFWIGIQIKWEKVQNGINARVY